MSARVVVVGDVMTDVIVKPEGPLIRGSDRRATIRRMPGGSGANQAVWLAHFGAEASFVARVGAGDRAMLEAQFRDRGVTPVFSADSERQTGVLVTIVDPDGERSFLTDRGANLNLGPADVPANLLDDATHLVISGYTFYAPGPRSLALALRAEARSRNIKVVVDAASEGFLREVGVRSFIEWTEGGHLLFANYAEAAALTGLPDLGGQMRRLGARYERAVIKRGALGAALGDAGGVRHVQSARQVEVIDTTGAGDAFVAAFLAAEIRGESEEACLAAGIEAGTVAVSQIGGQPRDDRAASVPGS